jgi:NTE family protein
VAFVLSGGGALGAVHAGQLRALDRAGVVPDVLVGVSAGALNGAFVTDGFSSSRIDELVGFWHTFDASARVFPSRRHHHLARLLRGHSHVEDPSGLRQLISENCSFDDLADASVPLVVVTTNLTKGCVEVWSSGPMLDVVTASASLPGVFPPVVIGGELHVDGGVLNALPVDVALDAGASVTFALDIAAGTPHRPPSPDQSALELLNASFALARRQLVRRAPVPGSSQRVFALPAPDTSGIAFGDSSRSTSLLIDAYNLTARFLDEQGVDGSSVAELVVSLQASSSDGPLPTTQPTRAVVFRSFQDRFRHRRDALLRSRR